MLTLAIIAKYHANRFRALVDKALPFVDRIVVAVDDGAEEGILGYLGEKVEYIQRALNHDFAGQRNALCEMVKEGWILCLDTDEDLHDSLWRRLPEVTNTMAEVIELPRANTMSGVGTDDKLLNWPDWQPKLHRAHVRWTRQVHEWPTNFSLSIKLPPVIENAIIHRKTVQDQERSNQLYASIKAHD